jgi:hypothetical protein
MNGLTTVVVEVVVVAFDLAAAAAAAAVRFLSRKAANTIRMPQPVNKVERDRSLLGIKQKIMTMMGCHGWQSM